MFFLFQLEKGDEIKGIYTSKEFFWNFGYKEKEQLHMVSCHFGKKK